MKKPFIFSFVVAAIVMMQACGNADRQDRDDAATKVIDSISDTTARAQAITADVELNGDEKTFMLAAASGGKTEVEVATIAMNQTKNPEVKAFASKMLEHHSKANQELTAIAAAIGMQLPTTLPDDKLAHLKGLQKLNDKKFDEQYITMMVSDHATTVKLFTEGSNLSNTQIKSFASGNLPMIVEHYKEAVKIAKKLNLPNAGNGDDLQGLSPAAGHTN